ncbi:MAG TPA: hypothetical protein VLG49_00885 [Rhabdochlamydiaceae bacterium]|nr:hypothetical protein [Rhabdochlamydiaceae bacterium]
MSTDQQFVEIQENQETFTLPEPREEPFEKAEEEAKEEKLVINSEDSDKNIPEAIQTPLLDPVQYESDKKGSDVFVEFFAKFEHEQEVEEKIRLAIDFMRAALSQSGSPHFKDFWEGRRLCLPLFKETINPSKRALLWAEYIELSAEARRLKEILDEQSAFAAEQIELAIQALEKDLSQYDEQLQQVPEMQFPEPCTSIEAKKSTYNALQRELYLLNTFASRVNALRKEVVKTEMRVRIKNKFFERLSACGDQIFPRRKEWIKQISEEFISDVQAFINSHFQDDEQRMPPLFVLREEIKALQAIAKLLTLNTHSFTETRLQLSECWDKVKRKEKERKKEFAQKKQIYKQNCDLAMEKITVFADLCREGSLTNEELNGQSDQILDYMRSLELGRDEVRSLKDEIHKARRLVYEKAREHELERERKEKEIERQKKERVAEFRNQLAALLQNSEPMTAEDLSLVRDKMQTEYDQMALTRAEKQIFERLFKQLKDAITDKKEKSLMNLSEDELQSLEQLKEILNQRKQWRQEIKNQLENYRKALGESGFDFEKAMTYSELINTEKARLEKANAAIEEIDEKLEQFENR